MVTENDLYMALGRKDATVISLTKKLEEALEKNKRLIELIEKHNQVSKPKKSRKKK